MKFSDQRYLRSKRTVDDRALDRHVVDTFRIALGQLLARRGRLRVLELGAGVGTMVARFVEWNLASLADYTLLDLDAASLADATTYLETWANDRGLKATRGDGGELTIEGRFEGRPVDLSVRGVAMDLHDFVNQPDHEGYDVLVANAFLDIVDLDTVLPPLWSRFDPEGVFWFTISFDGETILLPEGPLDDEVMRLYHRSMDERVRDGRPAGHSRTGRRLFGALQRVGGQIVGAGSSDWVVHPVAGGYPHDEAYFLHHIVETIWQELREHPELDAQALEAWTERRRAQIDAGELVYIAHQLDFTGTAS